MVARGGHSLRMLWRATCLFRELNALLASARSTASFSSDLKAFHTACTAASFPDNCPPHSWRKPEASCTSDFAVESIALAIIRLAVSLSSAVRRQARRGETHLGSTKICRAFLPPGQVNCIGQ